MGQPAENYGNRLYEGKAKILYKTTSGSICHYFKDSATAFNGEKKATIPGKGELNSQISSLLFELLARNGIKTHFLRKIDNRAIETLELEMIPIEVVVRNQVAGSLAKRLRVDEGAVLEPSIVEWYLKDDAKADPQVTEDILVSLFKRERSELEELRRQALAVNDVLKPFWKKVGLSLVDFKLEFGRDSSGKIILGDEISPDTCRLWDIKTLEKLDKDRFRFDLGDLLTGYRKILTKLEEGLKK